MFQDGRKLGYGPMHGIPMVATSPVRHDSPVGPGMIGSSDIQSYEPPWKALSDFALHTDLDRLNPNTPHFQHLVNQVSQYFIIFHSLPIGIIKSDIYIYIYIYIQILVAVVYSGFSYK